MGKVIPRVILFILLLFPSSCTFGEKPLRALIDSPCAPPCWQNIVPGRTTKTEVIQYVERIPEIDPQQSQWVGSWNVYSDYFVIDFLNSKSKGAIGIIDDTVEFIGLYDDLHINIAQAITIYGDPESVVIETVDSGDIIFLGVRLLYPKQGLVLNFKDGDLQTAHIQPGKEIEWVIFVDPMRFETTLTEGSAIIEKEALQNNRFPWNGYGNIKVEEVVD